MKKLYNSAKNIGAHVEPRAEERGLLYSNTADVRSSALGFNSNSPLVSREMAFDYLASVLVEAYFDHKELERNARIQSETGGAVLSRINERAG